jgi:DNA-binding MarR family transcriptional regulator
MRKVAEGKWLDEREQRAWRAFLAMQRQFTGRIAREIQHDTGLSAADYEVLVNLTEAPAGRLRAFELGMATQWEKSRLSHHITRMADRGLVKRESCPSDSRGAFVVVTAAGRKAIEAAAPRHVEHVRKWFIDPLTTEQLDALIEISEAIVAKLDDDPEACPPC